MVPTTPARMDKIKQSVVLVGPTSPRFKGGIVHYTQNLYLELKKENYPVELISFKRGYPASFFPGASTDNPSKPTHSRDELELVDWFNPWTWWQTARHIVQKKPKIVILQWWTWFWTIPFWFILLGIKFLSHSKIVIIAHNPFDHEQALYKQWCSHLVLAQADKIIVHNREMVKNLKRLLPDKKISLAFHPLYQFFKQTNLSQKQAQQQLKVASPLLLFFGHVRQYKGLSVLLDAMQKLWQSGEKINLIIAGEFWEDKQDYLKLIKPQFKERVKIVDRYLADSEVAPYFRACDAVVIPYLAGSGSGPAKIALVFDKPLVATDVADNPDLFALGKVGVLVNSNQSEALASGIKQVLQQKGQFAQAIKRIKPLLTWQQLVEVIMKP